MYKALFPYQVFHYWQQNVETGYPCDFCFMKRNKIFKPIAGMIATIMVATMLFSMTAFGATTYTPVAGTSCDFTKFLIMDQGDNVPNVTFSFTVEAGSARSADTSDNAVMQVLPGVVVTSGGVVTSPSIADVTFADGDTTYTSVQTGDIDVARAASDRASGLTPATGVQFESGEMYAKHTATVDFTGVTFDEPGIYRYIIRETASATHEDAGIMHDNDTDRVLDVYVVHEDTAAVTEAWIYDGTAYDTEALAKAAADADQGVGAGEGDYTGIEHRAASAASSGLVVAAYVLHKVDGDVTINSTMGSADVAAQGAALADKTDGFTNEYNSKDLVFKKEVTGNEASRDKWFEFTATLTNVNDDDIFTVSITDDNNAATTDGNADATSGTTSATRASNQSKPNPTSLTGAQLKTGVKFYLQHGQSIAIRGIAPNAGYSITEDSEDYAPTASGVTGYTDATATTGSETIATIAGNNKAVMTSYLNTRSGIVPTGIWGDVMKYAIPLVVIAVAGILFLVLKKKKNSKNK